MANDTPIGDSVPSAPASAPATPTPAAPNTTESNSSAPAPTQTSVSAGSGENIYDVLAKRAKISEFTTVNTSDGSILRVGVDLYTIADFINGTAPVSLKYKQDVTNISIVSGTDIAGIAGNMIIRIPEQTASTLKANVSNMFCVITICLCVSSIVNDDESKVKIEKSIMYQPYIFAIQSMDRVAQGADSTLSTYSVKLLDFTSNALKNSSFGNLREMFTDLNSTPNFSELYRRIIEFATKKKSKIFNEKFKFSEIIEFASLDNGAINDIVKMVLTPYFESHEKTLYDLWADLQAKAVIQIPVPKHSNAFDGENPFSDIMVPLFMFEEYPDLAGAYHKYLEKPGENQAPPISVNYSLEGLSGTAVMLPRKFYLRNLRTPFEMAFKDNEMTIFQTINPKKDAGGSLTEEDEHVNKPIIGYANDNYRDCESKSIAEDVHSRKWQNLSFLSDGVDGGSSYLIFFYWIYEYFNYAFLNVKGNALASKWGKKIKMLIDPSFLQLQKSTALNIGNDEDYAKLNATTINAKTNNKELESSYWVGQSLYSCVNDNEKYLFTINCNMLRRPNEIIKVNTSPIDPANESPNRALPGGSDMATYATSFLYIRRISHVLTGDKFENDIITTRFCKIGENSSCI